MLYPYIHSKKLLLEPVEGSSWAGEMVLNPAIIYDAEDQRIHMLFRATGPWPQKKMENKPFPYPICLGYGWSDDGGDNWHFDLSKPALMPRLEYDAEKIYIKDINGQNVVNHANGCIEDPRLFYFEGKCYMITACRMFPPGPYWEHDEPMQCAPEWAISKYNEFGAAGTANYTVNVLWRVHLEQLTKHNYNAAFEYVCRLTNPEFGEDRDVVFFPERLEIDGKKKIVMMHRPYTPNLYPMFRHIHKPSIVICAADSFEEFEDPSLHREILASPQFEWEKNRIGASAPPIKIGDGEWLLNYHGKQDETVGYTQSFMILKERENGFPLIISRCSERLIFAEKDWEMPNKFTTPCVFITGLIQYGDKLLASYGAADERVGIMKIDYPDLLRFLKQFHTIL